MRTTLAPSDTETVIRLEGPLDAAEAEFLRELLDVFATSAETPVVIDLSRVHWIDSIGVGVIIAAELKFRREGRQLQLRSPRPPVTHVLELTGVTGRLHIEWQGAR
jgi:anti-anti-sigma factor